MTDKNLKIALCAGIAVVAILVALLLSTCSGKEAPAPTKPIQTQQATEATEVTEAQATQAPTEIPTEPTEATEPATEPTEPEETQGSSGGSSTPGGSGSGSGSNDDDDEKPKETEPFEAPAAGSEKNPYVEVLSDDVQKISTVSLKEKESVYYEIYGASGTVLLMEASDVTLTMGETVNQPDETGLITLPVAAEAEPVKLQLTNNGAVQRAYQIRFAKRGSAENPEKLDSIASIPVELAEGDEDGYHYIWTATDTCELTLKPAKTGYRIQATYGGITVSNADNADGSLTMNVYSGMEVQLQVAAVEDEEGNYQAVSDVITCSIPAKGTEKNPIQLESLTPSVLELAGGEDHIRYYCWTAEMSGTFAIQVTGAEPETVVCGIALNPEDTPENEETPETVALDAKVLATTASVEVEAGERVLFYVETAPDETGVYPAAKITFSCTFTAKPGLEENPIVVTVPEDIISVPAGNLIYYKASAAGMNMVITGENLTVIVGGTAYEAKDGKVVVPCGAGESILFSVTNLGAEDAAYGVTFVKANPSPDPSEPTDPTEPTEPTEPDATEPDATEPDATEPDATEPDATEPDATEPDATEPDATEPDVTEPDTTEPEETTAETENNPDATDS